MLMAMSCAGEVTNGDRHVVVTMGKAGVLLATLASNSSEVPDSRCVVDASFVPSFELGPTYVELTTTNQFLVCLWISLFLLCDGL